ncbi:hypothetical protein JCM14469_21920 [Desulfatiferula olefinivorans]
MNVSSTLHFLPDYSRHPAWEQSDPGRIQYPPVKTPDASRIASDADAHRSDQDSGAYKYYVLVDARDMVYTRRKNLENPFHAVKGGLVNLYV